MDVDRLARLLYLIAIKGYDAGREGLPPTAVLPPEEWPQQPPIPFQRAAWRALAERILADAATH